jgi:hypothetical protein
MRLLDAAVANNASWCDAVCRSHGYPGTFSSRLWASTRHRLRFYGLALDRLWAGIQLAVAELQPHLPVVGYEGGASLKAAQRAGFHVLGTLRIWVRPSLVPHAAQVREE